MADYDPLPGSGVSFWSIMAGIGGSLLTLRVLVESSYWTRAFSVASGFIFAFFIGPAIAEHMGWLPGSNRERAIMLLCAFGGANLLAGFGTFLLKWRTDPREAIAWAMSLWRGERK